MDYTLSVEQRQQILVGRIAQAETEHFNHSLNLAMATAWAEGTPGRQAQIDTSTDSIAQLEAGLEALRKEYGALTAKAKPSS